MFEPVHGSAPDIAGQGKADPTAAILSAACCSTTSATPRPPRQIEPPPSTADIAERGAQPPDDREIGDGDRRASSRLTRSPLSGAHHDTIHADLEFTAALGGLQRPATERASARRSSPTPASARLHRPHVHWPVDTRGRLARRRASCRTARLRSTPPPRSCTTRRRSSRASRRTARPTARSGLPPRAERRAHAAFRAPARAARAARPRRSSAPSTRWSRRTERGFRRRRRRASTCVRSCSRPRRSWASGRRQHVTYCVIASPAGAYFPGGVKPVSHLAVRRTTSAPARRHGAAKCGGNYASSLLPQREARERLRPGAFLDAAEHKWVEELGGMNLYFVYADGRSSPRR